MGKIKLLFKILWYSLPIHEWTLQDRIAYRKRTQHIIEDDFSKKSFLEQAKTVLN